MLRLAKIVRFPERHYPSTVVDGAGELERLARCYVVGNVAGWFAVAKHLLGLATQMPGGLWGNGQVSVLVLGEC